MWHMQNTPSFWWIMSRFIQLEILLNNATNLEWMWAVYHMCVLLPLDVGVNGPFKAEMCNMHHLWCLDKYTLLTYPTSDHEDLYSWIISAFNKVSPVVRTFVCIGFMD